MTTSLWEETQRNGHATLLQNRESRIYQKTSGATAMVACAEGL